MFSHTFLLFTTLLSSQVVDQQKCRKLALENKIMNIKSANSLEDAFGKDGMISLVAKWRFFIGTSTDLNWQPTTDELITEYIRNLSNQKARNKNELITFYSWDLQTYFCK